MAPAATANTKLTSCHGVRTWTATLGLAAQSSMRRYHTPTLSTSRPRLTALSANARSRHGTELVLHRQLANPLRGCREDRVRDRRHHGRRPGLAHATRRLAALHQVYLYRRSLAHAQRPVVVEVVLLRATVLDSHFAPQGGRHAKDDAALHLRFHDFGIDDRAAVDRAHHAGDAHLPLPRHRHLGDLRDVAAERMQQRDPAPGSWRERLSPTRLRRGELEHRLGAR